MAVSLLASDLQLRLFCRLSFRGGFAGRGWIPSFEAYLLVLVHGPGWFFFLADGVRVFCAALSPPVREPGRFFFFPIGVFFQENFPRFFLLAAGSLLTDPAACFGQRQILSGCLVGRLFSRLFFQFFSSVLSHRGYPFVF